MPTGDYIINKKKLPSVTTIISRFKNATGLIIWSNQLGLKGLNYFDELKLRKLSQFLYPKSDKIVAVSKGVKNSLLASLDIEDSKIEVI